MKIIKALALSRKFWIAWMALGLILIVLVALSQFSLSALDDPSQVEIIIATQGKHILIGRSASDEITPAPATRNANPALGHGLFVGNCSSCHGIDGRTPTEMGLRMYPRVVDLGSEHVQSYTDEEIFWIVKNGIRLTGMPGLGDSQPDPNIWAIVDFIRSLPEPTREEQ